MAAVEMTRGGDAGRQTRFREPVDFHATMAAVSTRITQSQVRKTIETSTPFSYAFVEFNERCSPASSCRHTDRQTDNTRFAYQYDFQATHNRQRRRVDQQHPIAGGAPA
jgi:hypothetical protein